MTINIACPQIGEEEIEAVTRVMRTGMLAQGPEVAAFEKEFAEFVGVKHAIAVSNGSTALLVALQSLEFPEGSEVITTPFTFLASASSIVAAGLKPVFVDINPETFCMNPDLIAAAITDKTKAIMPVHLYGNMCEMDKILAIASKYNLKVVEDCAQSQGSKLEDISAGSIGDLGCFSFYPTKNMTSSEGGMITTDDDALARLCRLKRAHGMDGPYNYVTPGFNYRMTDVSAAIGREQLKKLPSWNDKRRSNASFYNEKFKGVVTPFVEHNVHHTFHQYTIKVEDRDELKDYLTRNGVGSGVYYPRPLYQFPVMSQYLASCPVAEEVCKKVLSLPVHPALSTMNLSVIVDLINRRYDK